MKISPHTLSVIGRLSLSLCLLTSVLSQPSPYFPNFVVKETNRVAFLYQGFSADLRLLTGSGTRAAQKLVDEYTTFINSEGPKADGLPDKPYTETQKYAAVRAFNGLFIQDRQFLLDIVPRVRVFSRDQRKTLAKGLAVQYDLFALTRNLTLALWPDLLEIFEVDAEVMTTALDDTIRALER